jgi:GntR family transcriptional repressor for pyruvate dehydrogenase complex
VNDGSEIKLGPVLAEQIVDVIIRRILSGELKPGDTLPAEREMARTFNVGRPAIREAIRALSMRNIVDVRQGGATRVAALSPQSLVEPFEVMFTVERSNIEFLFETRLILEPPIAALAAGRITDGQVAELEETIEVSRATIRDQEAFLRTDAHLHAQILQAAGNPMLTSIMTAIAQLGVRSRQQTSQRLDVRKQTIVDHEAITRAIAARDPALAADAMTAHLERILQAFEAGAGSEVRGSEVGSGEVKQ